MKTRWKKYFFSLFREVSSIEISKALIFTCSTLAFVVATLPLIAVPLVGDDFGSLTNPEIIDIANQPLYKLFSSVIELNNQSLHFNFLGQLAALLWVKFALFLNKIQLMDFNQAFYLTKFCVYIVFYAATSFALSIFAKIRIKHSLVVICFIMPIFLQNRAAWSNDPLSSTPFAGLISVSVAIYVIALFISKIDRFSWLDVALITSLNFIAVMIYELNVVVVIIELIILIPLIFKRNNSNFRTFRLAFLLDAFFLFIYFLVISAKTLTVTNTYSGTQFEIGDIAQQFKIVISALFSVFPVFSWNKSIEVLGLSSIQVTLILFISITLGIVIYKFIVFSGVSFLKHNSSEKKMRFLPLVMFWVIPSITQSLTLKYQMEFIGPLSVYIFVVYQLVSISIISSVFLLQNLSSLQKQNVLLSVLISISFFQLLLNIGLTKNLNENYKDNIAIIKTLSKETTSDLRCKVLDEWLRHDWPNYYRENLLISIDKYSDSINKEAYCTKS